MQGFRKTAMIAIVAGAGFAVALPLFAQRGPTSGPIARYDMTAATTSGFGAFNRGAMMSMMLGGHAGNQPQHMLNLRLGSSQAPNGAPHADHFMPAGMQLGQSVPLTTPTSDPEPADTIGQQPTEEHHETPKGRLLLFWGCGEHAPAGQPIIFDFAKMAQGQGFPAGVWTTTIHRDRGPTLENSKTFGSWPLKDNPNSRKDERYVKPESSLIGPHRIAGNYSPEINFTLAHDFMAALTITRGDTPGGGLLLQWNALPDATGYYASLMGGNNQGGGSGGDIVMWSSSFTRQFGGGLSDYLTPGEVAALVRDRTVLAPSVTSCVVPAEVKQATPGFRMGTLTAYGPEENFSYPPRPADPKAPWNLLWTARIRHRSSNTFMDSPGMRQGGYGGAQGEQAQTQQGQQDQQQSPPQQNCKPHGLGGLIGRSVLRQSGC